MTGWGLRLGVIFALLCIPPVHAEERTPPPAADVLPTIPYDVVLQGPADSDLAERLQTELDLIKKKARGVPSMAVLDARLQRDLERITNALHAYGYYDGTARGTMAEGSPARVTIVIEQGHLYTIGRYDVVWRGAQPDVPLVITAVGLPASGRNIISAGDFLQATLKDAGFYDAQIVDRRVVLDRPSGTVEVTVTVVPGGPVTVGEFQVSGAIAIPELRVSRLSKLEPGETLTPARLKGSEDKLLESGLFNEARAEPVGKAPARTVKFTIEERLPRTVSGAIGYSLQDGYSIQAAWEHRNLFGDAEKLRAELTVGNQRQSLDLTYRQYDTLFIGHTLLATLDIAREDVDNQKFEQAALIATLETEIFPKLTLRYGGSIEYVRDETLTHGGDYALLGVRAELSYDDANDLLDPTSGYRAALRVTPYIGWNGDFRQFAAVELIGAAYFPLDDAKKFVAAVRGRVGTILGDERDDIPIAKRFFAGGGGSIRGFGYKRAGPIDIDDSPIGGSSVVEVNAELRYRINEDFGAVVFVDGGGAFPENLPDDVDFFIGAGAGIRYYSPIGPVRLDVAIPIEGRKGEPDYQIYVSIGQAF